MHRPTWFKGTLSTTAVLLLLAACQSVNKNPTPILKTAFETQFDQTAFRYDWVDDYWEALSGGWTASGSGVSSQKQGDSMLLFRHPVVGDGPVRIEYDASSDAPGDLSLILGVSDPGDALRNSVFIGFASGENQRAQIRVPGRDAVTTDTVPATAGRRHRIAVEWNGDAISLAVDGRTILEAPCSRDDFSGNDLALYTWNPATFHALRIATPDGSEARWQQPAIVESDLLQTMPAFRAATAADHPRLFLKASDEASLRASIASSPTRQAALNHVIAIANGMLEEDPIEYKKTDRRLLSVSRTCLSRLMHLAFACRMTGDERYAKRAQQEMLAAAGFSDWNPSHFLDVAEMTTALAIGYDWLFHVLDPEARDTIREAIIEKGIGPSFRGQHWWITCNNNWNQVCHGGMTVGALAIMETWPDLAARVVERAVQEVPHSMVEYAPDGAYPEGPVYWQYGTTYNVILIAALESVLGTDFGLAKSEGFLESSDYYLHATGPTGQYFNYSDCSPGAGVSEAMTWFAARRNDPTLLWREQQALETMLSDTNRRQKVSERTFPLLLIWAGAVGDPARPVTRHWMGQGSTPVAMHRSGWQDDRETYVGLKGGTPSANHAHMDIGSFVMDADGVRWARDLGNQSYYSLESKGIGLWDKQQDGQRWDIFRWSNFSHNTLVVDGQKQRVEGFAPIVGFSDQDPLPHTIIDMTSVYDGQLAAVRRGVALRPDRTVLVQDELTTLDHDTAIRWGMVTGADVTIDDAHRATLRQDGQQLTLTILSPAGASLEIYETAEPPHDYDEPNPGTRMIGFTVHIPASTEERLIVLLDPGETTTESPALTSLNAWR
ncbi:MAG: heparinase II/III family protein [Verrucomicrobia bacterium]|nr:heparinase II/III family protein [Verrucomicrobiota bacterium]